MMLRSILSAMLSSTFILTAASHAPAGDRLAVFVSIVPQKYFVQQIGKDLVDVQVMVPPGAGSHSYAPKPRQMVAVSRARLYFAIGIEIEKATLPKILSTNPTVKVVHTDRGIQKISMTAPTHRNEEGEHHEGHQQEPGGLDPHIWLSPPLVKIQARTIMNTLQEIDPGHRAVYEANYRQFVAQIDQLDTELKTIFAGQQGLQFMVFHPAWGYFAQAYGLKQVPVEIEGKSPKPAQLKELIKHARKSDIKVVFVQPQFSSKSAKLVANEIGGQVAFADPLAENWLANLREVAEKFKATLK